MSSLGDFYDTDDLGRVTLKVIECVGGCPEQEAMCDYGLCRCKNQYEARFGKCYTNFEPIYEAL